MQLGLLIGPLYRYDSLLLSRKHSEFCYHDSKKHHLVQLRVLSAAITQTARWMAGREFVMKGDDDMTGSGGGAAEGSRERRSMRDRDRESGDFSSSRGQSK